MPTIDLGPFPSDLGVPANDLGNPASDLGGTDATAPADLTTVVDTGPISSTDGGMSVVDTGPISSTDRGPLMICPSSCVTDVDCNPCRTSADPPSIRYCCLSALCISMTGMCPNIGGGGADGGLGGGRDGGLGGGFDGGLGGGRDGGIGGGVDGGLGGGVDSGLGGGRDAGGVGGPG